MKNKNLKIAIGISAAAFLFLIVYLKAKENSITSKGTPNKVIIARSFISSGAALTADLVKEAEIPEQFIQPGAIRKIEDTTEKIALAPISEGEQILANKITKTADYLSSIVPIGKRAVTIAVDSADGLSNMIRPGDRADVVGTFDSSGSNFTATILQNIKVIAVNEKFNIVKEKEKPEIINSASLGRETITLAMEPSEAEILAFAENKGKLKMVLRNPGDVEINQLKQTNFGNFLRNVAKEASKPAVVNEAPSLEVIRGTQGEKIQMKKEK